MALKPCSHCRSQLFLFRQLWLLLFLFLFFLLELFFGCLSLDSSEQFAFEIVIEPLSPRLEPGPQRSMAPRERL